MRVDQPADRHPVLVGARVRGVPPEAVRQRSEDDILNAAGEDLVTAFAPPSQADRLRGLAQVDPVDREHAPAAARLARLLDRTLDRGGRVVHPQVDRAERLGQECVQLGDGALVERALEVLVDEREPLGLLGHCGDHLRVRLAEQQVHRLAAQVEYGPAVGAPERRPTAPCETERLPRPGVR